MNPPFRFGSVVVMPFWSQADSLNTDSNYVFLKTVLPEMERQTEETFFFVMFPDPRRGRGRWRYYNDGFETERTRFVPWPYDTSMRSSVLAFDPIRFGEIDQYLAPVVYWLQQVESADKFAGGYFQSFNKSARPTLIAQHHYPIHNSLPYRIDGLFPRLWAQIGGSLASDVVVYNSAYARKLARESFGEWANPAKLAELDARSKTLLFGLVKPEQPTAPPATAENRPTFVYNHRLEGFKRPDLTFGMFDELRARYDFDVCLMQPITQRSGGRRQWHFDYRIWEPDHDDYLAALASRPMINVTNSAYETFCISVLDSIAAGHLVVAPNALTFPELLPPDYPFLFDSIEQQRAILDLLLSEWPKQYNDWRGRLVDWARERFAVSPYVREYLSIMAAAESFNRDHNPKQTTIESMTRIWDGMKPGVSYDPLFFRRQMTKHGEHVAGGQSFVTRRIVRDSLHFRNDIGVRYENGALKLFRRA